MVRAFLKFITGIFRSIFKMIIWVPKKIIALPFKMVKWFIGAIIFISLLIIIPIILFWKPGYIS